MLEKCASRRHYLGWLAARPRRKNTRGRTPTVFTLLFIRGVRGFLGCKKLKSRARRRFIPGGLPSMAYESFRSDDGRRSTLDARRRERRKGRRAENSSGESTREKKQGACERSLPKQRKRKAEKEEIPSSRSRYSLFLLFFFFSRVSARYPRLAAPRSSQGGNGVIVSHCSRFTVN